jgi:1-phosphofructokinase
VTLVGPVGGEVGPVLAAAVEAAGLQFRAVPVAAGNGAYVHDRRSGERRAIAEAAAQPLARHDADELFGAAVVAGRSGQVCVLAGPGAPPVIEPGLYERLSADVVMSGVPVVADVPGAYVEAALAGGAAIVKVSAEDLQSDGRLDGSSEREVAAAARRLARGRAGAVVVTRAEHGTIAASAGRLLRVSSPRFTSVDPRGAGDSFTGAVAAALARGAGLADALRLGAAAGALNVTRRGLGSGSRRDIEELATEVEITELEEHACGS